MEQFSSWGNVLKKQDQEVAEDEEVEEPVAASR
jgi:hypothetical protein